MQRHTVRNFYKAVALSEQTGCGSASSPCCTPEAASPDVSANLGYSTDEIQKVPQGANMGLGCGNPQTIANLKSGETVVDLGSGGGFDCFLAAAQVGEKGHVIGVDMTAAMVAKARENVLKTDFKNVEFRLAEIEHLPVADSIADIVISNCVINLSPDKPQVLREAYRVLKPGGRLAVSDIVATREIPEDVKNDMDKHSGCVAGAAMTTELQGMLSQCGFTKIEIHLKEESRNFIKSWFPGSGLEKYVVSADIEAIKPDAE